MKGIELSERFYNEYGAPMLRENFSDIMPYIAVGLVGSGSECFGYDDRISTDHDFEPGFCIFLPGEDTLDRRTEFLLEREHSRLPKEFMGYKRSPLSPVGGNRHGVIRTDEFFTQKTGRADGALSSEEWFFTPEQSLAEAVNGKVFFDGLGRFTEIRERLIYMPEDIRLKKLAGELILMGQAGKYNYPRSLERGDTAAAQLAAVEFVNRAMHTVFLINKKYMPYYKWSFRALSELENLVSLSRPFEHIISSGNTDTDAETKLSEIDGICNDIFGALRDGGLSAYTGDTAEGHADAVNRKITDPDIRNLHILYAV